VAAVVDGERLRVTLRDGRELAVPLSWFEWLAGATDNDRTAFRIDDGGTELWWDRLHEGISVPGLFGLPETPPRPRKDRYVVEYRHDGRRWIAELEELDSSTWGLTLDAAKQDARLLLAQLLGVDDVGAIGIEVVDEVHQSEPARA
jgi:hypothetical protein